MRKQELRAWHNNLVVRASQVDWYAYRTLSHLSRLEGWHHKFVDGGDWKQVMTAYFEGIFAKAPKARTAKRLGDTRKSLTASARSPRAIPSRSTTSKWPLSSGNPQVQTPSRTRSSAVC